MTKHTKYSSIANQVSNPAQYLIKIKQNNAIAIAIPADAIIIGYVNSISEIQLSTVEKSITVSILSRMTSIYFYPDGIQTLSNKSVELYINLE